ncbi:MAG: response regulator [Pseudomonadales bacterium]
MDIDIIKQISTISFVLHENLRVTGTSNLLKKYFPNMEGKKLDEFFEIQRPKVIGFQDYAESAGQLVLAVSVEKDFAFRGQFIISSDMNGELKFVGSPWLSWITENTNLSLNVNDFSSFDVQLEQLVYSLTQTQQLRELETLNKELSEAKKELEKTSKAQSDFFSLMSHEMRTPTASIYSALDLIDKKELKAFDANMLKIAKDSVQSLRLVIDDVLNYSKLKNEGLKNEPVIFEPEMLLKSLEDTFLVKAKDFPIAFHSYYDGPEKIFADAGKIKQVLSNLIDNALKFTGEGFVNVFFEFLKSKQKIRIRVADTGEGIPKEQQELIFTEYWTTKSHFSKDLGVGLGLSLCSKMIEVLGGSICFESFEGKGSCFYLELPAMAYVAAKKETETKKTSSSKNERLKGKILIAEDNFTNRYLIQLQLSKLGLDVDTAVDGNEVIRKAQANNYDLILMDISMPNMDGIQATKHLRQTKKAKNIPIIAMTAFSDPKDHSEFINAGMNQVITKPAEISTIKKIICQYCQ